MLLALTGCATRTPAVAVPPPPPTPAEAATLQAAPPGMTRLYILRPGISDAGRADSPMVLVDGQEVAELGHRGFSSVALPPGARELSLRPGRHDARGWAARLRFRAAPGEILFLAVLREVDSGAPALPAAPVSLAPLPGASARAGGVSFEFMRQIDALPMLPALQFARPQVERIGARP